MGQNTVSSEMLTSFVERVERIRADKKALADDEAAILAEAKAAGFLPAGIRAAVRIRAMKPHVRQEAEAILDTYLHALGMAEDTPLFRQVGLMSVDTASRESVIEALKAFVPDNGSIVIEAGGKPVRLTRDEDGKVTVADVVDTPSPSASAAAPRPSAMREKAPPPDVDDAGAEALGGTAFKANAPIITNPFPFGDARRPKWDAGWRKASGTDGMGPDGGDD